MINWNALHEACVDRISFYKKEGRKMFHMELLSGYISRYEALMEFIDTRIQTINKTDNEIHS